MCKYEACQFIVIPRLLFHLAVCLSRATTVALASQNLFSQKEKKNTTSSISSVNCIFTETFAVLPLVAKLYQWNMFGSKTIIFYDLRFLSSNQFSVNSPTVLYLDRCLTPAELQQ